MVVVCKWPVEGINYNAYGQAVTADGSARAMRRSSGSGEMRPEAKSINGADLGVTMARRRCACAPSSSVISHRTASTASASFNSKHMAGRIMRSFVAPLGGICALNMKEINNNAARNGEMAARDSMSCSRATSSIIAICWRAR